MSYNVRYFGHATRGITSTLGPKRRIAAALLALDPPVDIMCLQEVETASIRANVGHRKAHPEETQLEAFMTRLEETWGTASPFPYEGFHFRAHTYRLGSTPLYTTGLAVIVRTDRLRVHGHNVEAPHPITHHHLERWKDRKQSRICAHMHVEVGEKRLHIFNTHLSLPTPWDRSFWREKQKMGFGVNQLAEVGTLASFVRSFTDGDPYIVCGDFNSPPASPAYVKLKEELGLADAQVACGQIDGLEPRAFPTAGFLRLRMHLDHIFGRGVEFLGCEGTRPFGDKDAPFHGLSDHVPLIATLRI
jgi:endonuclease/exonuclease/phosphatase family metal-dependent hydrolase